LEGQHKRWQYLVVISVIVVALPLFLPQIFSAASFLPHTYCYLGNSSLITLHVASDILIWLAYVVIAFTLGYLVRRGRHTIPFHWMFLAFGFFIVACGFTHLLEVITLWQPLYWLAGYVKAITAVASVATAVMFPPLVPKIISEIREAEASRQIRAELAASNNELEAFSYSVSHDLRAPLRAIDGFSRAVLEDSGDKLDEQGKADLQRVCAAAKRMGSLIDDLLNLARTARSEMTRTRVDLSSLAQEIYSHLRATNPARQVEFKITPGLMAEGDEGLLRVVLENLLGNAWKFSGTRQQATIEFGREKKNNEMTYFVRDNGVGFDVKYAEKLFAPFQRMHDESRFPGTGVGLATVQRIIRRHGGRIWVEAAVEQGASFYFVLPGKFSEREQ
jgi:signal transduction histidine kinase